LTPHTIIWDFDGTLYPLHPYDSEQSLLRLRLEQLKGPQRCLRHTMIRWLIHADMQQWFTHGSLRHIYGRLYGWCLKGTPVPLLDRTAEGIAALISLDTRKALHRLCANGFRMLVISCGTLDLSERVLMQAGIRECFEAVQANPLRIRNNLISGVAAHLITAHDKLRRAKKIVGHRSQGIMAVGDGYTDIPLLDWVEKPVMIDPGNVKKRQYPSKPYLFVPSIQSLQKHLLSIYTLL